MKPNQRIELERVMTEAGKKDGAVSSGIFDSLSRIFPILKFGSKNKNSKPKNLSTEEAITLLNNALPTAPKVLITLKGKDRSVVFVGKLSQIEIGSPIVLETEKGKMVSQSITSVEHTPSEIVITTSDGKIFLLANAQFSL